MRYDFYAPEFPISAVMLVSLSVFVFILAALFIVAALFYFNVRQRFLVNFWNSGTRISFRIS